ncbi:hypothetical protein [Hyalangium versicolor]|uniref:hypothetical protein n=1 Tax=Hyalangium versicolor TaxID=2861190 RepID=UPI001CCDC50A|nr:hypothetical protein [Hyalangium versicolor]
MSLRATVAILVLSTGCGAANGSVPSPSPGAQPARKLEGPVISAAVGSFKPTFFYGPWQCNQKFMDHCTAQCAAEGYKRMGCIWLADLKLDWQGAGAQAGGAPRLLPLLLLLPRVDEERKRRAAQDLGERPEKVPRRLEQEIWKLANRGWEVVARTPHPGSSARRRPYGR